MSQGSRIEGLEKSKLPEFDFDDPNTQVWIENQLVEHQKKNPSFSMKDLVSLISQKVTVFSKDDIAIAHDELFVVEGKICAMAPDLKNLPEINYEDPEVKKWMAEEEAERVKKYGKPTSEQIEAIYQRREELQAANPSLSFQTAFDQAHDEIMNK